jgi:hypothetical protein
MKLSILEGTAALGLLATNGFVLLTLGLDATKAIEHCTVTGSGCLKGVGLAALLMLMQFGLVAVVVAHNAARQEADRLKAKLQEALR